MCIAFSPTLFAQNRSQILVHDLVKHWQTSKSLSLAVAEAMPEDAYRPFKPSDPEVNFADVIGTIALQNVLICSGAFNTRAPERFQSAFDRPMDHTKISMLQNLKVAYDFCIDGLTRIDDRDLLEMAGHRETTFDRLWNAIAHATHLLGQAEVYLRLRGAKPPDTGPKYEF